MKNKLTDLNDHLFLALERVNDDDLKGEELKQAIDRARSVANIGREIVQNARVVLAAQQFVEGAPVGRIPALPDLFRTTEKPALEAIDGHKK